MQGLYLCSLVAISPIDFDCFITFDLLLSYPTITLASHASLILITARLSTPKSTQAPHIRGTGTGAGGRDEEEQQEGS